MKILIIIWDRYFITEELFKIFLFIYINISIIHQY